MRRAAFASAGAALALAVFSAGALPADELPEPFTGSRGDPARGRAIVTSRQAGLCLLCHNGPFPEEKFQGNLAPSLEKVGSRIPEGEIRMQLVDPARFNSRSLMPAYRRSEGLERVAPSLRGKPLLTDEQIEDVVAFLVTLK